MSETSGRLERRVRALLRAYPAEYRHGRAEEIVGTLLEAAPPGRSFPPAREAWSLIAGGRHARAARNRRPGIRPNVRLALLLGISIWMSSNVVAPYAAVLLGFAQTGAGWRMIAATALCAAATLAPWLGSRAAATALAIPAGALIAYVGQSEAVIPLAAVLIPMAALAALSGGPVRLPRSWIWLPCAPPATLAAGRLLVTDRSVFYHGYLSLAALSLLAVVVVGWLVTDARPAFGLCVAHVLGILQYLLTDLAIQRSLPGWLLIAMVTNFLLQFALVVPVLLPAAWLLLRRQKAASPRPFPEP